jgi:hypothetical protein
MNDNEKLKEYMQENALKEKKRAPSPPPPTPEKTREKTARSWHTRRIVGEILGNTFFTILAALVVYGIAYMIVDVNHGGDEALVRQIAYGFFAVLFLANIGTNIYKVYQYRGLIDGKHFKIKGWDDFFSKRSWKFWTQRYYTTIKIIIKLAPGTSDLQLESVRLFTKKTIEKWDKHYEGIDWEPGHGQPKDLTAKGTTLTGEFSSAELMRLVKILNGFAPLAKLLGKYLEEVVIESNDKEHLIKTKKVSRNAYDRQSGRGQ